MFTIDDEEEAVVKTKPNNETVEITEESTVVDYSTTREQFGISEGIADEIVAEFVGSKDPVTWSAELLTAVVVDFAKVDQLTRTAAQKLYIERNEIPLAWTTDDLIRFINEGTEPAKTERGNWVKDLERNKLEAADWTTGQLEDWAELKIDATPKAPHAQLAMELKARLNLQCGDSPKEVRKAFNALKNEAIPKAGSEASQPTKIQASSKQSLQLQIAKAAVAQLEKVEGLTPMQVANIDDALNRYIEAVKPGAIISDDTGLKAQNALDNLFEYIVSMDPQAMVKALERLKGIFQKNMGKGGVFESSYVYRFTHLMRTEKNRRDKHIGMLEAMRVYFGPSKEARKQIDVRFLLRHYPNDKMELLAQYFTQVA